MGKNMIKNMLCEILILMKGMWYTVRDLRRKEDGLWAYIPLASAICCHSEGFTTSSPQALLPQSSFPLTY